MADEYRAEQGTVVPTMFIGLGGTGSRIVNRIALRASRLPNWKSQLEPLTSFVALDTNQFDLDRLDQIPVGNRLQIGGFDKPTVIQNFRDDRNQQAEQWMPPTYQPRRANTPGAGQIRLEARLDFFYRSPEVRARLREVVRRSLVPNITWRRSMPADYHVYLFCTLA